MTPNDTPFDTSLTNALRAATHSDDLDDACRTLQDALGVTDGGLAGACFSDLDDRPEDGGQTWKDLSLSERRARLISYLKSEMSLMTGCDEDPGATLSFAAFQNSRRQMSASAFGALVGDAMWEDDPDAQFFVYNDQWWIEICADGRHMLTLENRSWVTGPEIDLEALELELFRFVKLT